MIEYHSKPVNYITMLTIEASLVESPENTKDAKGSPTKVDNHRSKMQKKKKIKGKKKSSKVRRSCQNVSCAISINFQTFILTFSKAEYRIRKASSKSIS